MTSLPPPLERKPARFMTYKGDLTGSIIGEVVGPNAWGEHMIAVDAEYDSTHNKTRVGFAYLTTTEYLEHTHGAV